MDIKHLKNIESAIIEIQKQLYEYIKHTAIKMQYITTEDSGFPYTGGIELIFNNQKSAEFWQIGNTTILLVPYQSRDSDEELDNKNV